jgi:hypothetical protein
MITNEIKHSICNLGDINTINQLELMLINDSIIHDLCINDIQFELTGGAIIDILEERIPKDYDFLSLNISKMRQIGMDIELIYETEFSITYRYKGRIFQHLKTSINDFDYTISQTKFTHYVGKVELKFIDDSFACKQLTPVSWDVKNAIRALIRLPHWFKKGYSIHEQTYLSLVRAVEGKKSSIEHS